MSAKHASAQPFIPPRVTMDELKVAVQACRGCDLWERGTQAVFGEGPVPAEIMLVGEQPGDAEDRLGHPFVGPAGRLLDKALEEVGIHREDVYLTNAVKHFKWEAKGKRRMHEKPSQGEIRACEPWLFAELALVRPRVVVLLGATAAQTLLGRTFRLTQHRGEFVPSTHAPYVMATVHPSAVLRSPDDETRAEAFRLLVADLLCVPPVLTSARRRAA